MCPVSIKLSWFSFLIICPRNVTCIFLILSIILHFVYIFLKTYVLHINYVHHLYIEKTSASSSTWKLFPIHWHILKPILQSILRPILLILCFVLERYGFLFLWVCGVFPLFAKTPDITIYVIVGWWHLHFVANILVFFSIWQPNILSSCNMQLSLSSGFPKLNCLRISVTL